MKLDQIVECIEGLFETTSNPNFKAESGVTVDSSKDIKTVGYCTNLTLEVIEKAKLNSVDLIITHHNAWGFIYGLSAACTEKLQEYEISHYYNHLPLDDCDFGTNDTLLERLNLKIIEKTHEEDGFFCGRVAEFDEAIEFSELVSKLETLLEEPVKAWQFNDRKVKRIGLVCGGGGLTPHLKIGVDKGCDVYITGEKILYTIEYAQHVNMSLIIGSHTFTETLGVESLVVKLKERLETLEVVKIEERHLEAIG